jgi:hypothetical protein
MSTQLTLCVLPSDIAGAALSMVKIADANPALGRLCCR